MNKKIFVVALSVGTMAYAGKTSAQNWGNLLDKAKDRVNNSTGNNSGTGGSISGLSNTEIVNGLKEALNVGTKNASGRLNITNGFFGNAIIKVLMPPEAQKVEAALRRYGMGNVVDKAILSMNRAAEDAAGQAAPIFINAITSMNIQDGLNILKGGNGAATNYLRSKTSVELTNAFKPVISRSLNKVNATALWAQVFKLYNQLPTTTSKINPDLTAYVTERALNGLFVTITDEENKIRTNANARVSDLLKKVFGAR